MTKSSFHFSRSFTPVINPQYTFLCPSLIIAALDSNHTRVGSLLLSPSLLRPLADREAPVSCHQGTAEDVDDLDQKDEEAISRLLDGQKNRLDVVFEEDAWNSAVADLRALLRHCILIREQ